MKNNINIKIFFFAFVFFGTIISCKKGNDTIIDLPNHYNYLISDSLSFYFKNQDIIDFVNLFVNAGKQNPKITQLASAIEISLKSKLNFGVKGYIIKYKSSLPNNSPVVVSGLILVPDTIITSTKLASFERFTLSSPNSYPTSFSQLEIAFEPNNPDIIFLEILALVTSSGGYVVSCPDYIGAGVSSNLLEAFTSKQSGIVSADMLLAVAEFFTKKNIKLSSDSVSIYGYSEGGYVAMATHQVIEQRNQQPVRFSFCGGGIYNPSIQLDSVFKYKGVVQSDLGFLLKLINSQFTYYATEYYPLSVYINQPYASRLTNINPILWRNSSDLFPDTIQSVLNENFLQKVLNRTDSGLVLYNSLLKADIYNWKPINPITIFQGANDVDCFPANADSAYTAIKRNGGNVQDLDINKGIKFLVPGLDHSTGAWHYIAYVFQKLFP